MPKGRLPQNIAHVPIHRGKKALKLRDFLTTGSTKERLAGICLTELSQLFLCFKKFAFNEEACAVEIGNFQKCYYAQVNRIQNSAKNPVASKKSTQEIGKLLKRFPTV